MGTNYIAPTWRMPEDTNKDKLSNYSLDFNGSNFIDCGNDSSVSFGTENFSISCWFKTTQSGGTKNLVINGGVGGGGKNYALIINSSNKLQFAIDDNSANPNISSTTNVNDGSWHHAVAVRESGNIKLYLDSSSPVTTTDTAGDIDSSDPLKIGAGTTASNGATTNFFDGGLNQVAIFDYALSETQIKYLYNNNDTVNPTVANPPNPMAITGSKPAAYYDLGGNSNPTSNSGYPNLSNENGNVFSLNPNGFQNQSIALNQAFSYPNGFTISFWFKQRSASGQYFFDNRNDPYDSNSPQRVLVYGDATFLNFYVNNRSVRSKTPPNTSLSANVGKWTHVACVYNPNATFVQNKQAADFGTIYINGVNQSGSSAGLPRMIVYNSTMSGAINPALNITSKNARISAQSLSPNSSELLAQVSNFAIFDTSLPGLGAQSVDSLYNNGSPPDLSSYDNLKVWYQMNSSTSTWDGSNWEIGNSTANYNSALRFNYPSGGSAVDLPVTLANTLGNGVTNMSASIWFNLEDNTGEAGIFSLGPRTVAYGKFAVWKGQGNGNLAFNVGGNGANYIRYNMAANSKPDKTWYHLLVTYDASAGSTRGDTQKMYLNGEDLNISNSSAAVSSIDLDSNQDITQVGRIHVYRDDMKLSNFAVYDTTLTAADAITLYNGGTPQETISGSPLSWLTLKDTSTSTGGGLFDNGSVGANGILGTQVSKVNTLVSTLNGVSTNMNTSNLVPTDLFRNTAFSNYSVRLDGATNYLDADVSLGNLLGDNYSGAISFSGWIKCSNLLDQQGIFSICKENSSGQEFSIFIDYTGTTPYLYIDVDGYGDSETAANVGLVQGEWAHIVWVYQQSDSTSDVYVNGVSTSIAQTVFSSPDLNSKKTFLGNYYSSSSPKPFNGEISNFAVWNQKLTSDNVNELYNKAIPQDISSFSPAPIRWWPMDGSNIYYNGSEIVTRELKNNNSATGVNTATSDIVGETPGSEANGTGSNITITNLKGDMANSINNSSSINMADYASGTNPANSGRSTNVP